MVKKTVADFNSFEKKLKKIIRNSIRSHKYNRAMSAISCCATAMYEYNQYYTDDFLEYSTLYIGKIFAEKKKEALKEYHSDPNIVLFYDGFGLDIRGVSKMYLNALIKNQYKVIYLLPEPSKGKMPETEKVTQSGDVVWRYFNNKRSYSDSSNEIIDVILETLPKALFFYTTPGDVSGAVAFTLFQGKVQRFLIDLTDHAFWLGKCCNDFFCGSREMSASNQYYGRGIPKEKCIKLGVNLVIEECTDHSGLPFDVLSTRYIFSGGALYKTLGDDEKYYYKIVDHILSEHQDVKYLYAGLGNDFEMKKILKKYPDRAYLISERKDFYYLIQNSIFYLNTYPMFGGMMMKYAANASRIPITLRHDSDADGLLINQDAAKIQYDSYDELISDIDRLLNDDSYMEKRRALLKGTIITEERFINNVRGLIEQNKTDYEHGFYKIDTSNFRKEFLERFDLSKTKERLIKRKNTELILVMPNMYFQLIKKIYKVVKGEFKND